MRRIIFGIRKSALANKQLFEFIAFLKRKNVNLDYRIKTILTQGDRDRKNKITAIGTGIFTKEIERALINKEIDCAVHSLKDVPVKLQKGTKLSCFAKREDRRDCLVLRDGLKSGQLAGLKLGTDSPRRMYFIQEIEPKAIVLPIRGNIDTRIRKMNGGKYDGLILAACGLKRLGYENLIVRYFDSESFVPAAGQGIICAQTRDNDKDLNSILRKSSCIETEKSALLERNVLKALGIGCRTPFGVYAKFIKGNFSINAKYYSEKAKCFIKESEKGAKDNASGITDNLIASLKIQLKKINE
ncbi:MAG: hydroxymethylbilane synthase [Candidatus Omnitrophica bacterium]|nr:hydroxymethylbilane synthase [Candidatus Omnitrophota bacterium]